MKKYLWLILLIILSFGGYYFFYVHNYRTCINRGGQAGHDMVTGFCEINGERYYPVLPKGMTD